MGLSQKKQFVSKMMDAPQTRTLKKGDLLFAEGENSHSMYFLKKGMIRIYKKRGKSNIELDTIHAGSVLGELAFLDGNPRSASGEALTDCLLIEISGSTFTQTLSGMPDWLKLLLKTIVTRLRSASTRIRQLESVSTAFDYSSKAGPGKSHYVYLSPSDVLKICASLILVGSRNGKPAADGKSVEIKVSVLQRYANQIIGIPVAKVTSLLDLLAQEGMVGLDEQAGASQVLIKNMDFIEKFITYLNEENLLEPSKRHDISLKGFLIMKLIVKHLPNGKKDAATGLTAINMAVLLKAETQALGKEPFRFDEFPELVKLGYCTELDAKSSDEILTRVKAEEFALACQFQKIIKSLNQINEEKSRT